LERAGEIDVLPTVVRLLEGPELPPLPPEPGQGVRTQPDPLHPIIEFNEFDLRAVPWLKTILMLPRREYAKAMALLALERLKPDDELAIVLLALKDRSNDTMDIADRAAYRVYELTHDARCKRVGNTEESVSETVANCRNAMLKRSAGGTE